MNNPVARRALLALSHPLAIAALLILLLNDHGIEKGCALVAGGQSQARKNKPPGFRLLGVGRYEVADDQVRRTI